MKKLFDGKEVENNVPTKITTKGRVLLNENEIAKQDERRIEWEANIEKTNAKKQINVLERQISKRRIVEAVLGIDKGWLQNQYNLIKTERGKL